jgi:hypothetical protein
VNNIAILIRICLTVGIAIVVGKQLVLSFVFERAFDVTGFLLSMVYTAVMLSIPVYFTRINRRQGGVSGLSTTHTLGFILGFFLLYLVLFFSRLIMLIEFFARNPVFLLVEFVMMVAVLVALSTPFIISGRRSHPIVEAQKVDS